MFGLHISELVVILIIVLVLFGPARLPDLGGAIGRAIRNFKGGLAEGDPKAKRPERIGDDRDDADDGSRPA